MDGIQIIKHCLRMMKPWNNRSEIEASLFNPAFCGELILRAVSSYNKTAKQGNFPYALSYLVLPFLMTSEVTKALPSRRRTSFITWLFANRHLTPLIANKAKELKDYTNEALLLDLSMDLLQLDDQVELKKGTNNLVRKKNFHREEVEPMFKMAEFVGSWLGDAGDMVTIYSIIGITV